jgi:hypothetical protein
LDTISPTLKLNYPDDGSTYVYGEDEWVTVNADVSDNLSMDRVDFFIQGEDAEPFAVRRVAPFNARWTIARPGRYAFYVVAYDAAGNKVKSDTVTVNVIAKEN